MTKILFFSNFLHGMLMFLRQYRIISQTTIQRPLCFYHPQLKFIHYPPPSKS